MQDTEILYKFAPRLIQKWGQHLKFCKKKMTQQEFTERTKVEVSSTEFEKINEFYMNVECDKDEFCKMWCKMNPSRVKNAKVERMMKARDESYRAALRKWFDKWNNTQKFYDNYNTLIAYTRMTVYEVQAMSYADIRLEGSLSDVHFKVGQYLGIYRSL